MRAVTVRDLAEAEAALGASREAAPAAGMLLLSAPGAAAFPGPAALGAILALAALRHPGARHEAALDCGAAPGHALEALRRGWRILVLDPECPAWDGVRNAAAQAGALLLPARPEALALDRFDLSRPAGRRAARDALRDWLAPPAPRTEPAPDGGRPAAPVDGAAPPAGAAGAGPGSAPPP